MVYNEFGKLYNRFSDSPEIQTKVTKRWDFISTEYSKISYILTPKFAAVGFYFNNDKLDILNDINNFVERRYPGLGQKAEEEAVEFITQMMSLSGTRRESVFNMPARSYWKIFGQTQFPTLFLCAKVVNEMICSSASSERAWSIYRFIHSRLRNRLANEKVEKLAFIYINCAILDKNDNFNYILEDRIALNDLDYENNEDY